MHDLNSLIKYRDFQLDLLDAFVHDDPGITPPNLILLGGKSSGKTYIINEYFNTHSKLIHCILDAAQMVTWKPFVQHVAISITEVLKYKFPFIKISEYDPLQAEDFSLLIKYLYNLFLKYGNLDKRQSLFIILDNFDRIDELDIGLLPKFLKLHEMLPDTLQLSIKFIFLIRSSSFMDIYSTYSIPTIVFPRYTQSEVSDIIMQGKVLELAKDKILVEKINQLEIKDVEKICIGISSNFANLILQSFQSYTGNDIEVLSDFMELKWPFYLESISKGNYHDTIGLYKSNLNLFKSTGDTFIDDENDVEENKEITGTTYELSFMSKYLLIASYLCSYLDQRFDSKVFSKKSHLRSGRSSYGRRSKMETNPRYLQPSLFPLERMLAIFQSIYPTNTSTEDQSKYFEKDNVMRANVEVYENIAELNSLKLITSAISKNVDYLHERMKWKVNVPWEIITEVSSSIDFDIAEYFSNIHE